MRACDIYGAKVGMEGHDRLTSGVHPEYTAQAEELWALLRSRATAAVTRALADAEVAARRRDDDHVGTEHVILGLYASTNAGRAVLERCGISRVVFESILVEEPGPSPPNDIPWTVRAMMIGGLAVVEADRRNLGKVDVLQLLVGTIRESERWAEQHAWGPHHLRSAAEAAGTSIATIREEAARPHWDSV